MSKSQVDATDSVFSAEKRYFLSGWTLVQKDDLFILSGFLAETTQIINRQLVCW
jgi:hypothetical protein